MTLPILCRGHSWQVRLAKQRRWLLPDTWSHLWFAGVRECPPWCSIVGVTVTVHQFFCILHLINFSTLLFQVFIHIRTAGNRNQDEHCTFQMSCDSRDNMLPCMQNKRRLYQSATAKELSNNIAESTKHVFKESMVIHWPQWSSIEGSRYSFPRPKWATEEKRTSGSKFYVAWTTWFVPKGFV